MNTLAANIEPTEALSDALHACRGKRALALVNLTNLDNLETQCGVAARHEISQLFSTRLNGLLRPQDTLITFSSDRAILVMDDLIDVYHLQLAGMKLAKIFEHPIQVADETANFNVFTGFLYLARPASTDLDIENLIQRADSALTSAKNQGKTDEPFFVATIEDETIVENHWQIGMRLREAMTAHHIYMDYQPKINLTNGELAGAEALVRWRDNGTVLPPTDYLPALQPDLMWELTTYCFRRVIRDVLDYDIKVPVAVNFDPVTIREPDLIPLLQRETALWGVAPEQLILEITEVRDLSSIKDAHQTLQQIRELGFKISIDDFGSGHSNLERLRDLPMDELKIDRSFCGNITTDNQNKLMTKSVIELAKSLNVATVAEGIEDAATLELLREWGCDLGQGFYLSAPLPIDALGKLSP
ncbi:MAG: EAL domain-containing protein (putative c-di-GMP-specific phosphodiesterase class I) [Limisphaerales bacterium]|jgi:EAL domain-containing protein (putative c-di-GMP-specific phosphodiesterase class I)/GGDEF domain-containing protein